MVQPISKHCIFCGRPPQDKNREHVLPEWLIQATGDPSRTVNLGLRFDNEAEGLKLHRHAFSQYVFPACKTCNDLHSNREQVAKQIFLKLWNRQALTEDDIQHLLDWLDKVRVGLWLGGRMLGTNLFRPTEPNFFIDQRIGSADRAVYITVLEEPVEKSLTMFGTGSALFGSMPSVFGLRANSVLLISMSCPGLFAKRLGLPFPRDKHMIVNQRRMVVPTLEFGTGRTKLPLIRYRYPFPALKIFQPNHPVGVYQAFERQFKSASVKERFYDEQCSVGKHYRQADNRLLWMQGVAQCDYQAATVSVRQGMGHVISRAVLELQNVASEGVYVGQLIEPERYSEFVRMHRDMRKLNDKMNDYLDE